MSKVVAPALRIGYPACSDRGLIRKIGNLRQIIDVQGDNIMEQAILQLIKDGTIKKHIRKATQHYKAKRDLTENLLRKHIKDKVDYTVPDGGLAFWIVPRKSADRAEISDTLIGKGIKITTPDFYSFNDSVNGLRLGYGLLSEKEIEAAVTELNNLL